MLPISQISLISVIPNQIVAAFQICHYIHLYIRIFQQAHFITEHPYEYTIGQGLYATARKVAPLKMAAQALLIIKRTINALEAHDEVQKTFRTFRRFNTNLPVPTHVICDLFLAKSILTGKQIATIRHIIPHTLVNRIYRIITIARYALACLRACVQLSNALIALFEATLPNKATNYEGITGICTNIREIYEKFSLSSPEIYRKMQDHQPYIDKILFQAGFPITCNMILNGTQYIVKPIAHTAQNISSIFENIKDSIF